MFIYSFPRLFDCYISFPPWRPFNYIEVYSARFYLAYEKLTSTDVLTVGSQLIPTRTSVEDKYFEKAASFVKQFEAKGLPRMLNYYK